jgi:hypothetical protein
VNDELPEPYDLSGVTFPSNQPLRRLRQRIIRAYPEDAKIADRRFEELYGGRLWGDWLVRFAETTAAAMKRRDDATLRGHLAIVLSAYQRGGAELRRQIDVNYMEELFYEVEDADAQWGWQRVPAPLRELYIDQWSRLIPRLVDRVQLPDTIPS